MKFLCFLLIVLSAAAPAQAEQLELVCRIQGRERDMVPLMIDLKSKSVVWGDDASWIVVNESEKYITIRTVEHRYTLGGMYWVIDRFSGEFVQTYVGMMARKADGADSRLDGYMLKGVCNRRKF